MANRNPHNICSWGEPSDCVGCSLRGKLACRWDRNTLNRFYVVAFPPIVIAVVGMVVVGIISGVWWPLIAYVVYIPVMLGIFETRFLCSHCPYYAEDSGILHCLANHGNPKLWRYRPGPMNGLEKFMMVAFVIAMIYVIFPLAVEGYGIWFLCVNYAEHGLAPLLWLVGITVVTLIAGITTLVLLRVFFCSRCVNFSCPLNTVPEPVIDEYLKRNDTMRKAWEESGFQMRRTLFP